MSAITSGGSLVWAVAAGLTGPIFQGGRILQNYRATLAEREQAVLQYQQAVITALREVADSLTALAKLRDAEAGQDRSVKALQEAVALATDRYRFGLASYYEVLEAQQQLFPAQQTLAQIRRDRLTAYVALYKALGGGWQLSDAQWTAQNELAGKEADEMMPRCGISVDRAGRRAARRWVTWRHRHDGVVEVPRATRSRQWHAAVRCVDGARLCGHSARRSSEICGFPGLIRRS